MRFDLSGLVKKSPEPAWSFASSLAQLRFGDAAFPRPFGEVFHSFFALAIET
jgi:hypothetical protein